MKLGIIRGYSNADFDYVKGMGLKFIESCRNNDAESIDFVAHVDDIKANIARTGIPIASVGRWAAKPNVGGKIDEVQFKVMQDLFDAAVAVGSPVFVCGCNYDANISLYKNYTAAIELFGRFLDRAEGKNIKVAVYNCDWENFVCRSEVWNVVLGELPKLMIKYDCSHSYGRGQDYLAELSDWGDRVAHMHVKGAVKTNSKRHVDDSPAGMDALDWKQIFAIMYSRNYDGGLSIEPHSSTWRADSELGNKGIQFTINYISQFIL